MKNESLVFTEKDLVLATLRLMQGKSEEEKYKYLKAMVLVRASATPIYKHQEQREYYR